MTYTYLRLPHTQTNCRLMGAILVSVLVLLPSCSKPERPSITLHAAAAQGNLEQLKRHLYWGCDVNAADSDHNTPLGLAAKNGHVEAVKLLVSSGADIARSEAVHYAAEEDQEAVLQALLGLGASINITDSDGYTALHKVRQANRMKSLKAASFLISHGADVNARTKDNFTPLHGAAMAGDRELCELLIRNGANVLAQDKEGRTPLHDACLFLGTPATVALLISKGADVNATDKQGWTPLHCVAALGPPDRLDDSRLKLDVARLLLTNGARTSARSADGLTPARSAYVMKYYDLVRLLEAGT